MSQKAMYYKILFVRNAQNRQLYKERKQISGWLGSGKRWWGVTANEYVVSLEDDKNVLNSIMVVVAQFYEYTKTSNSTL